MHVLNKMAPYTIFMQTHAYHMINVEKIKFHVGQILLHGWVTGNKEFTLSVIL